MSREQVVVSNEQRAESNEQRRDVRRSQIKRRFHLLASAPFGCFKASCSAVRVDYLTTSRFRLQSKRNRQDGDSGAPFQTITRMKSLNTLRVCLEKERKIRYSCSLTRRNNEIRLF
ncbi:MAG: hypothetical protein LBK25_03650 [Treponema sp.]|nr:hypothetical protein [Treponema sp.]